MENRYSELPDELYYSDSDITYENDIFIMDDIQSIDSFSDIDTFEDIIKGYCTDWDSYNYYYNFDAKGEVLQDIKNMFYFLPEEVENQNHELKKKMLIELVQFDKSILLNPFRTHWKRWFKSFIFNGQFKRDVRYAL